MICRQQLVIDSTNTDDEAVVGDECHVVSGKGRGPRYDPSFPTGHIDEVDNLVLLCRVHHKMVDDQAETYTVELLSKLKANHEKWVSSKLSEEENIPPVKIRRIKENIPPHLTRITNGRGLIDIVGGACAGSVDHDELNSDAEVSAVGAFAQEMQDWIELSSDLEAGQKVEAAYRMSTMVKELEASGFLVFGAREVQRIEGGVGPPSAWPVARVRIVRTTSPEIIKLNSKQES